MKLSDMITRTRLYVRDATGRRFPDTTITAYIQEAVDRIRMYSVFNNMPYPDNEIDQPYLPIQYHYLLPVYASSRLYELDNDYYQAVQRRNEFESVFSDLISLIESGEVTIYSSINTAVENKTNAIDAVEDVYFNTTTTDEESGITG